jgi:3-dehydroquinate synthase
MRMKIEVELGSRSYKVLIEDGLIGRAAALLEPFARDKRLIVVSDERVWSLHGERLVAAVVPISLRPLLVPPGEASKSWSMLNSVVERLLAEGSERSDHVVAFGGGVIGDLAGFAAAIVNRGCGFVQIPTTLLAQVDSSVGGKTGINAAAGKNLVGAFHQPSLVLIDPALLGTLNPRELRAGYAEVVKYGLIDDAAFFDWLEAQGARVLGGDADACRHAIATSVASKARIVAEDERETSGRRALLNLGHTFAHALEAETGYGERLLHGEAVAVGMVLAFDFSVERGLCPPADAARVRDHLSSVGLPVSLSEVGLTRSGSTLLRHMMRDKKVEGGRLTLILARGIGAAFVEKDVDSEEVERLLDRHL